MIAWLLRRFVSITAALALAAYVLIQTVPLSGAPIRADGYSYYVYLPSWFIYADPTLEGPARDCCGGTYPTFTAITRWASTGRWIDPHPIGEAVLMTPFFLAAHGLTRWSNLPADGFSIYYQHAAALAGISALLAGLACLRRLLRNHFSDGVTLATLVSVTWGTNLFHYGVYDSVYSHVFSFCVVAMLLLLTDRWWQRASWVGAAGIGATAALIVLVRHPNAPFLSVVPLYGLFGDRGVSGQLAELWRRRGHVALMALITVALMFPQLVIYGSATGHWFVSAYGQVGSFTFGSPHLLEVLIGVRKGLFFWSPVLLGSVGGALVAGRWVKNWLAATMAIFAVHTYLIASWSDWQLGGSFGHRGFTDGFSLAAVFLAAFFAWASQHARVRALVTAAAVLCVALSVVQMTQYWLGVLPISDISWDQYRALFLQFR
jgi:hypothetical protein